jgi:hypothetical protein
VSGTILLSGKHDTEPRAPEKWFLTPLPPPLPPLTGGPARNSGPVYEILNLDALFLEAFH